MTGTQRKAPAKWRRSATSRHWPGSAAGMPSSRCYMPEREDRFTALIDAVAGRRRADPLVLDLGCGPGSLAVRLLDRLPKATVVAIDADPVLLALGRSAWRDRPGLRFAELDMRSDGWAGGLGAGPARGRRGQHDSAALADGAGAGGAVRGDGHGAPARRPAA